LSALSDALAALKTVFLLEERITSQARKVERLADQVAEMDRRLARMEGQMQGFIAGAAAFASSAHPSDIDQQIRQIPAPKA
jgi:uncharacterized coiled-coil protein SlyX